MSLTPDDDRCGAVGNTGVPCKQYAGAGTDHKGEGRCWRYGGTLRTGAGDIREDMTIEEIAGVYNRVCGVPSRRNGTACKMPAGAGTDHKGFGRCRKHGGNADMHREVAHRDRVQVEGTIIIGRLGITDPTRTVEHILMDEVHRSDQLVAWIQSQLEAVDVDADGKVMVKTWVGDKDSGGWEFHKVSVLEALGDNPAWKGIMDLYRAERVHLRGIAKDIAQLGIAERMVALDEQKIDAMHRFVERLIVGLGHDPNDNAIREIVSDSLLALESA